MVTAAAVIAFVFAAFDVIAALGALFVVGQASSVRDICSSGSLSAQNQANCQTVQGASTLLKVISVALILLAVILVWGGVTALSGRNQKLLVIGSAVYILLGIVSLASGGGSTGALGFVGPVLILVFLLNANSRNWFRAKGGSTF